jgi:hypothetical protein
VFLTSCGTTSFSRRAPRKDRERVYSLAETYKVVPVKCDFVLEWKKTKVLYRFRSGQKKIRICEVMSNIKCASRTRCCFSKMSQCNKVRRADKCLISSSI